MSVPPSQRRSRLRRLLRPLSPLLRPVRWSIGEPFWRAKRRLLFSFRDPVTLNEKIQYRMVFDRRHILTQFVDKYAMRQHVIDRIGEDHLPQLYAVVDRGDSVDWDELPSRFALKATHGCGATVLVDDRVDPEVPLPRFDSRRPWGVTVRVHPKQVVGTRAAEELMDAWLTSNYWRYHGITEWAYKDVPPRIIFEELLDPGDGSTPLDHKLWCFNGEVGFLTVDDRNGTKTRSVHLPDWTHVPRAGIGMQFVVSEEATAEKPDSFADLTCVASRLSEGMDFVRVDLYNLRQKIVVGELTVYPIGGAGQYSPESFFDEAAAGWDPTCVRRSA